MRFHWRPLSAWSRFILLFRPRLVERVQADQTRETLITYYTNRSVKPYFLLIQLNRVGCDCFPKISMLVEMQNVGYST